MTCLEFFAISSVRSSAGAVPVQCRSGANDVRSAWLWPAGARSQKSVASRVSRCARGLAGVPRCCGAAPTTTHTPARHRGGGTSTVLYCTVLVLVVGVLNTFPGLIFLHNSFSCLGAAVRKARPYCKKDFLLPICFHNTSSHEPSAEVTMTTASEQAGRDTHKQALGPCATRHDTRGEVI